MRVVAWSLSSDWHDYWEWVVEVKRLSGGKWWLRYSGRPGPFLVTEEVIVIADRVWVEAKYHD